MPERQWDNATQLDASPSHPSHSSESRADWRGPLLAEITKHRTSDAEIMVLDPDGKPVSDVTLRYELVRHEMMLGTAVVPELLLAETPDAARYRQSVLELFNTVVFENEHKWKYWESSNRRATTDAAVAWVRQNQLRLRGHAMIWQTWRYGVPVPKDVELAARSGDTSGRPYVMRRSLEHIEAVGTHYRDIIEQWDVLNEQVDEHELTKFLNPDTGPTEAPAMLDWFAKAREAAPGARLFINDYHILVGDFTQHKADYEKIIQFLVDNRAPVGGIGFQGHFHGGYLTRTPEQIRAELDRFGKFGLPLLVTEFDMFGDKWGSTPEEIARNQTDFFERFFLSLLSHPQVQGLMVWGFWDGRHWANSAPFYHKDWVEKGALGIYRKYVLDQWRSRGDAVTGASGQAKFRGFHGLYRLAIRSGDTESQTTLRLTPASRHFTIRVPWRQNAGPRSG